MVSADVREESTRIRRERETNKVGQVMCLLMSALLHMYVDLFPNTVNIIVQLLLTCSTLSTVITHICLHVMLKCLVRLMFLLNANQLILSSV